VREGGEGLGGSLDLLMPHMGNFTYQLIQKNISKRY
jgi:hypothetical protein